MNGYSNGYYPRPAMTGATFTVLEAALQRAGLISDEVLPWRKDALCPQFPAWWWFPDKGGSGREAREVCAQCPVREACLEEALSDPTLDGIWAGTTVKERARLRKAAA